MSYGRSRFFQNNQSVTPPTPAVKKDAPSSSKEAKLEKCDPSYTNLFNCVFANMNDQPGHLFESCGKEFEEHWRHNIIK